jgi:phosphoglycolate phosphatase
MGDCEKIKIKAILFDLDGTLTDSALDLSISVNYMLEKLGFEPQPVENIYRYIGRGVKNMLAQALGEERLSELEKGITIFREHYWEHCLDNTRLYDGAKEAIEQLNGFKKAVVTNKTRIFAVKILEGLDVAKHFDIILGGDDYPALKPAPAPILLACEKMGELPSHSLMVGDSIPDMQCAVSAGAFACGVTYGLGTREELLNNGARWLINSLSDLPDLVRRINLGEAL